MASDAFNMDLLKDRILQITSIARKFGLDFFPMRYEVVPSEVMYYAAAVPLPGHFPHWSFGKGYHIQKTQYDHGYSRIYELVFNTDPCVAYLLEHNPVLENSVIAAHVLGHSDFFKNNCRFANTNRNMITSATAAAYRIRSYETEYGYKAVEEFIDAAYAIQYQISPYRKYTPRTDDHKPRLTRGRGEFDDIFSLGVPRAQEDPKPLVSKRRIPDHPEEDILLFFLQHGKDLEPWQQDILSVIREEAYYFRPQMETKILNEGWATYWHLKIMHELDLNEEDSIGFAHMHSGVVAPHYTQVNPYLLGYEMLVDIEKRWDKATKEDDEKFGIKASGMTGIQKLFDIRSNETDLSFIRNYLDETVMEKIDLFSWGKLNRRREWKDTDIVIKETVKSNAEAVKETLLRSNINAGIPIVKVADADFEGSGILLIHDYSGDELELEYASKTLPYVSLLSGGKRVNLSTVMDDEYVLAVYNPFTNEVRISKEGRKWKPDDILRPHYLGY